jgi:hypothetical protein
VRVEQDIVGVQLGTWCSSNWQPWNGLDGELEAVRAAVLYMDPRSRGAATCMPSERRALGLNEKGSGNPVEVLVRHGPPGRRCICTTARCWLGLRPASDRPMLRTAWRVLGSTPMVDRR